MGYVDRKKKMEGKGAAPQPKPAMPAPEPEPIRQAPAPPAAAPEPAAAKPAVPAPKAPLPRPAEKLGDGQAGRKVPPPSPARAPARPAEKRKDSEVDDSAETRIDTNAILSIPDDGKSIVSGPLFAEDPLLTGGVSTGELLAAPGSALKGVDGKGIAPPPLPQSTPAPSGEITGLNIPVEVAGGSPSEPALDLGMFQGLAPAAPAAAEKSASPDVPMKETKQVVGFRNVGDKGPVAGVSLTFAGMASMFTPKFTLKGKGFDAAFELEPGKAKAFTSGDCTVTVKDLGVKDGQREVEMAVVVPDKAKAAAPKEAKAVMPKVPRPKKERKPLDLGKAKYYAYELIAGATAAAVTTLMATLDAVQKTLGSYHVAATVAVGVVAGGLAVWGVFDRRKKQNDAEKTNKAV